MKDVIILGGGIASLSAAIHCAEIGLKSVLIEGGSYPMHKICGEFLSPECLPMLSRWGITPPMHLKYIQVFSQKNQFTYNFDIPAGSMSRYFLDHELAQVAAKKGVEIQTNTLIQSLKHTDGLYSINLSSGKTISAPRIIIGTGRILKLLQPEINITEHKPFMGFKAHFSNVDIQKCIQFYIFSDAYLGVSPIEDGKVNIACIAKTTAVNAHETPEIFIEHLMAKHPLKELVSKRTKIFPQWLSCSVPNFGIRKNPNLPNAFFIGDASGSIPPATGDGIALGLLSGKLVAQFVQNNNALEYHHTWHKLYGSIFRNGQLLHNLMLNQTCTNVGLNICNHIPSLAKIIYRNTRRL